MNSGERSQAEESKVESGDCQTTQKKKKSILDYVARMITNSFLMIFFLLDVWAPCSDVKHVVVFVISEVKLTFDTSHR